MNKYIHTLKVTQNLKPLICCGLILSKFNTNLNLKSFSQYRHTISNIRNYSNVIYQYISILENKESFHYDDILSDERLSTQRLMSGIISYNNTVSDFTMLRLMKDDSKRNSLIQRLKTINLIISQL